MQETCTVVAPCPAAAFVLVMDVSSGHHRDGAAVGFVCVGPLCAAGSGVMVMMSPVGD